MRKSLAGIFFVMSSLAVSAQAYDSETKVDTNNTSTSTSTVTSTNTNNNTNNNINDTTVNSTSTSTNNNINTSTSTNTNNNNNVNTSTSTNTNNNNNVNTTTSNNTNTNVNTSTNTNYNVNSGEQTFNNNNVNDTTINSTNVNNNTNTNTSTSNNNNVNTNNNTSTSTSENTNKNVNENTTKVEQPPPTAIAPSMMSGGNNDLCTTGTSGAVQTQILGVSSGGTVRDLNCERLKNAKTLFDMGMKVAAVSVLCQDRRVFDAMWNAGTPCPFEGKIGEQAKVAWLDNPGKMPQPEEPQTDDFYKKTGFGALLGYLLFIL